MILSRNHSLEEIYRKQRDGARCGCRVCASAISMYPAVNRHEPSRWVIRTGLPTPDAGRPDRQRHEQGQIPVSTRSLVMQPRIETDVTHRRGGEI